VELVFSVGRRRFSVVRSPQWERPSKRGGGTTTEQARVLLQESIDGEWVQKSARNDEAGLELTNVLGMDKEQFTRVVMLPQGEFAAFLRADATSRRSLLQRLFSTDRFENVEKLLNEQAAQTASALASAEEGQRQLVLRALDEAGRHGVDAGPDAADPTAGTGAGALIEDLLAGLEARAAEAGVAAARSAERLAGDKDRYAGLAAVRARALALQRYRAARERHEAGAQDTAGLSLAVARHQDARTLAAVLDSAEEAAREDATAKGRYESVLRDLLADETAAGYLAGDPGAGAHPGIEAGTDAGDTSGVHTVRHTVAQLDLAARAASAELGVLRAALPDEDRLRELHRSAAEVTGDIASLSAQATELTGRLTAVRAEKVLLEQEVTALRDTAAQEGQRDEALESARLLETIIGDHAAAEQRRVDAEAAHNEAQEEHLRRKELWLARLQLRLEQAAVELAGQLEDGAPCAVCGSVEHPAPARAGAEELVTHESEQAARSASAEAEARLVEARGRRDAAALEAARLAALGGTADPAGAREATRSAETRLAEARTARRNLEDVLQRIEGLADTERDLLAQQEAGAERLSKAGAELRSLEDQAGGLAARLELHRGRFASLHERAEAVDAANARLTDARGALEELTRTAFRRDKAHRALEAALGDSDFADAGDVRAAMLEPTVLDGYQRRIRDYEAAGHRLAAERESSDIAAALQDEADGREVPTEAEVEAAAREHAALAEHAAEESMTRRLLEQSVTQLVTYAGQLAEQETMVAPLRERYELVRTVAEAARGGGDNRYKMSLSTYVLASRLEQVAEAATERLLAMSDGRFALVHSDALSGNKKAGLGLSVIDGWTGNRRDTSTLSGGESFMASLAMALGLADVVQQEAGGIDIETLFVDEGFGSLDEQALEQVMDALEGLRSGGRVVGLVSHVAELKQRIPAQLQVIKGREGSRLEFVEQLQGV
jgi:exonuclease SbcC